ncbi:hypothetical protein BH23GEM9_BH23GEM9_18370 [soil metagenome]
MDYQAFGVPGRGKLSEAPGGVNSPARSRGEAALRGWHCRAPLWRWPRGAGLRRWPRGAGLQRWPRAAALCGLLLVGGAAGCAPVPFTIPSVTPGRWTVPLGDSRNTSSLAEHVPAAVEVEWQTGLGRGLPGMPMVLDDLVIAVVSGGGIATASASTGQRYWSRRFNGSVAGQPVRVDDHVYFATQHRDGTVYALEIRRGRRLWSRHLGARTAADVAYADGILYVTTDRGEIAALNARDGSVVWRVRIDAVAGQAPLVMGDELIIATVRDTLLRVARDDGAVRARTQVAGAVTAPIVAAGDTLVLAMAAGIVAAYAERGARELWRHELGTAVLAAPVIAADGVYAVNRRAELFRLSAHDATRIAALGGAVTQSLTATANGFLIGRLDGSLLFLDRDGAQRWEHRLNGSIRAPTLVRGSSVFATTLAGRLVKLSGGV